MRVTICAVGRLRDGPQKALVDEYLARFDRIGRANGLGPAAVREIELRSGGDSAQEAVQLAKAIPKDAVLCALDERGRLLSSPEFSRKISDWRDEGRRDAAFLIGGADGLDPDLRARAALSLSFGPMVWPHMLARVMLAEQLYRAASILSGSPYHRV